MKTLIFVSLILGIGTLEYYLETGKENGRDWYIVYILVRFVWQDIIAMVEQLETERITENILRKLDIREATAQEQARQKLLTRLDIVLANTSRDIREGVTGS